MGYGIYTSTSQLYRIVFVFKHLWTTAAKDAKFALWIANSVNNQGKIVTAQRVYNFSAIDIGGMNSARARC